MDAKDVIRIARKHVNSGYFDMESSARLCLADAIVLHEQGNLTEAKSRALKAIAYTVGEGHPDYKRASV